MTGALRWLWSEIRHTVCCVVYGAGLEKYDRLPTVPEDSLALRCRHCGRLFVWAAR